MPKVCIAGAINWDINLFVKHHPRIGEEIPVSRIARVPGGKGANIAVASARILGVGSAALIGSLGDDEIGRLQLDSLRSEGVDISGVRVIKGLPSGQAFIVIDEEGRNLILTYFGSNLELKPDSLEDKPIQSLLNEASVLVIVDPPIETCLALSRLGRSQGKVVVSSPGVRCKVGIEGLGPLIRESNYIVINRLEAEELTGYREPSKATDELIGINDRLKVVITLGEEGAVMMGKGFELREEGIGLAKLGMKAVNTTGCGDVFIGVLASCKAKGMDDRESLMLSNAAAAYKASKEETRGGPKMEELEAFLARVRGY